jgi:serine/threonine protein kinase
VPAWLADPLKPRRRRAKQWDGLINRQLLITGLRAQRGKGGVYEAFDVAASPGRNVIVKEGRRHGETDWDGTDGLTRIRREFRVLRTLARSGVPVPDVLRRFNYAGNSYVVLEAIRGKPMIHSKREQPSQIGAVRATRLLATLGPLLTRIHKAGWVWRDCKPQHIFMSGDNIRLMDFEGACRIAEEGILPWGSPDYMPPVYRKPFALRKAGTLEDDYALGVIAFQFLAGEFPHSTPSARRKVYKRTGCPKSLRDKIEALLAGGAAA